jgi:RNA polymerase sigma-70 factor (ECF subfamily)
LSQGDREQAEDLVQQVFQAAIMSWETIGHRDSGGQMAWLYRVLYYKAADAWHEDRRECSLTDLVSNQLPSPRDTGYQALCSIALDRALKLVMEMPPVRHRVVCLRLLAGLPSREVAGMLGIEQSTVRGHVEAARAELRKEVGPILPFIDDDPDVGQRSQEGR